MEQLVRKRDVESAEDHGKYKSEINQRRFIKTQEKVRLQPVKEDEFTLSEELWVAKYDSKSIAEHWNAENKRNAKPNVFKRAWRALKKGLWGNTVLVLSIYLIAYYLFNIVMIQWLCAKDPSTMSKAGKDNNTVHQQTQLLIDALSQKSCPANNTSSSSTTALESLCHVLVHDTKIIEMGKKEATFTRLLTFLIGFYVSFTIARWWTQVTSVPTIDNVCLALEGYLWCDDSKNENEIFVKDGVTVTQFKQTIVRYCLLSWTMCLSLVSPRLIKKFTQPQDFNERRLLTFDEYESLKTKNKDSRDGWKVKWTVPLLWVNAMLNEAETITKKDGKLFKIKELKEILKTTTEFQRRLHQVFEFNDNQMPDLILQAINLGLWFWLLIGIYSSQGLINKDSGVGIPMAILINFPLLHLIKYMVMFGWLRAATYLQNPFGEDEYVSLWFLKCHKFEVFELSYV